MPPSSFSSFGLTVWEEISFEEFKDGHLGFRNGMILAILNPYVAVMPPSNFCSIRLTVWEEMSFEEFQDSRHGGLLGCRTGTILAILNLCVIVMPPI